MLPYGMLLELFLGLNSVRFHCNNISSEGTMIFFSIELSDKWKLTQYIMHTIKIYKVLKNGPKMKIIPSFKRDHIEYKNIINNEFDCFLNTAKGR